MSLHVYRNWKPFFYFVESMWLLFLTKFDKPFFLLHFMVHVINQNMESRKNMVQVLPVTGCSVGPQLPMPVTTAALSESSWNFLEPIRVIFVLNNFKGLLKYPTIESWGLNVAWNGFPYQSKSLKLLQTVTPAFIN